MLKFLTASWRRNSGKIQITREKYWRSSLLHIGLTQHETSETNILTREILTSVIKSEIQLKIHFEFALIFNSYCTDSFEYSSPSNQNNSKSVRCFQKRLILKESVFEVCKTGSFLTEYILILTFYIGKKIKHYCLRYETWNTGHESNIK